MAIYTGGIRQHQEAKAAGERIARQKKKAAAGERKRKKRGFWGGKIGGFLAGQAFSTLGGMALTGLTGGAINPMTLKLISAGLKGVGMTAGKAAAHQATTGKWGKRFKSPGQVDKIKAGGKYGYGAGLASTLSEGLAESRKSEVDLGTLAGDVGGAIVADVGMDKLGGFAKEKLGGITLPGAEQNIGDWAARTYGVGGEDFASKVTEAAGGADAYADDFWDLDTDIGGTGFDDVSVETAFAQGGQVPQQQQQLLAMLALAQMQQKETAYSGTILDNLPTGSPRQEEQQMTLADYFGSQGKTLGGNNTQSIAQMMGK